MLLRPVALGAHLFAIFCVGLAVFLGFWQLSTWQGHRDAAAAEHVEQTPVPLDDALGPDEPFQRDSVGRTVSVVGSWLPESTVYVRDRVRAGENGYWVLTPVAVTDGDETKASEASALFVVRGWAASIDPRPAAPEGPVSLTAWLQPPEGAEGLVDDDRTDDIIPQVRMADAVQHVDQDLYGGYGIIRPADVQPDDVSGDFGTDGLEQVELDQVPEVAATTGWRNFLYATEWWIFAGFAAFIWIRWCRDEVIADRTAKSDGTTDGAVEGDPSDTSGGVVKAPAGDLESAG